LPDVLNDVRSVFPTLKKLGNQFWWMLEVAVQHDDRVATTLIYSSNQGELVPEAPGHYQKLDPRVDARDFRKDGFSSVGRRIENVKDAARVLRGELVSDACQPRVEKLNGLLLLKNRADDVYCPHRRVMLSITSRRPASIDTLGRQPTVSRNLLISAQVVPI